MLSYIFRRLFYALPILLGVNALTFALFFMLNSPDAMARMHLGDKYTTPAAIARWKHAHQLDKPLFFEQKKEGIASLTDTLFFQKSIALFTFHLGQSMEGRDIKADIQQRALPSLALAIPILLVGWCSYISFTLLLLLLRTTYLDRWGVAFCTLLMSISPLFYIIGGQFLLAKLWHLVPVSGYLQGIDAIKSLLLPVIIGILSSFGGQCRWYRAILLEELNKPYVNTARAKGLSELSILFKHVLRNGLIPMVTHVVALIPGLFMGSLLLESFFGIPGLGSYMIDALQQQDFNIVRVMVFLGTLAYITGLILTDIAYTWIDPRITFHQDV